MWLSVLAPSLVLTCFVVDRLEAAFDKDQVIHLPGWSPRPLSSKQYSGFLDATKPATGDEPPLETKMHYWLALAEEDPVKKPLIFWFNGGPGASSLFGFQTELGPYLLTDESVKGPEFAASGIPQLFYNPTGWQKVGSLVALSMPPPIGFSYCHDKPSSTGTDCGKWDDASTAAVTYSAIRAFFVKFPEFLDHEVYLTGESYVCTLTHTHTHSHTHAHSHTFTHAHTNTHTHTK